MTDITIQRTSISQTQKKMQHDTAGDLKQQTNEGGEKMTVKNVVRHMLPGTYLVVADKKMYDTTKSIAQSIIIEGRSDTLPITETGAYESVKDMVVENIGIKEYAGKPSLFMTAD